MAAEAHVSWNGHLTPSSKDCWNWSWKKTHLQILRGVLRRDQNREVVLLHCMLHSRSEKLQDIQRALSAAPKSSVRLAWPRVTMHAYAHTRATSSNLHVASEGRKRLEQNPDRLNSAMRAREYRKIDISARHRYVVCRVNALPMAH